MESLTPILQEDLETEDVVQIPRGTGQGAFCLGLPREHRPPLLGPWSVYMIFLPQWCNSVARFQREKPCCLRGHSQPELLSKETQLSL